jgi:hypothetical protein
LLIRFLLLTIITLSPPYVVTVEGFVALHVLASFELL